MSTTVAPANTTLFSHLAATADRYTKTAQLDIHNAILLVVEDFIHACGGYATASTAVDMAARVFATWVAGEFVPVPATASI